MWRKEQPFVYCFSKVRDTTPSSQHRRRSATTVNYNGHVFTFEAQFLLLIQLRHLSSRYFTGPLSQSTDPLISSHLFTVAVIRNDLEALCPEDESG